MINRDIIHEYHFVVNKQIKVKILKISEELKLNLSQTIIYIIENISSLIDKMHLKYKEENNLIQPVNWDTQIHVYINTFFLQLHFLLE